MYSIFDASRSIMQLKYRLGAMFNSDDMEVDCFGMIARFIYIRYADYVPLHLKGIEKDEFYKSVDYDKEKLVRGFIEYLEDNFNEVNINYSIPGDVLVADEDSEMPTIGISTSGNALIICTPETGVTVVDVQPYKLSRAFRWVDQPKVP